MSEKKRGLTGFARGMLIYVLLFVMLSALALGAFALYLDAYEQSRPVSAVRAYLRDGAEGQLSYAWGYALAQMDTRVQTEEEALGFARELLAAASFRELLSDTEGVRRFGLYDENGFCFAQLVLTQTGRTHWGFTDWAVTEVTTALQGYTHTASLTLPESYTVELNGDALDARFVAERGIDYELLLPCAELVPSLPKMQRWEIGPCLEEPQLRVLDEQGREVPEDARTEQRFLSNCSAKEREQLESFTEEYMSCYLPYAGDLRLNGYGYWSELSHLIVRGGELEERLVQARKGFGYGNTKSLKVLAYDFRLFSRLTETHWFVDFGYTLETEGLHGAVEEDYQLRLLIREEGGKLLTEAMYSY